VGELLGMYAAGESHLEHWNADELRPILERAMEQREVAKAEYHEAL
jgi:hypothetical protein